MSWQILLALNITLTVAAELMRRKLGRSMPQYNRMVNAVSIVGFHMPVGIVAAHFIGYDLNIDIVSIAALIVGTAIFPFAGILGYKASKDVDAGLNSILSTIGPVITIILAMLLLNESLSGQQMVGTFVIVLSAIMVSAPAYIRSSTSTRKGITIALVAITTVAFGTVYEAWLLNRIGLGTYLLLGWGMQAAWMSVFAWPERSKFKQIFNRKYGVPILAISTVKAAQGLTFLAALSALNSASLFSSYKSFLPVLVVIASYIFLKEKDMLKLRLLASLVGSVGLLILSLS